MISHIILPVFPMRPVVREGSGSTRRVGATVDPPPDRDRMLEEMKWLGGKIFMTSLSHEDEARLQAALGAGAGTRSADAARDSARPAATA